MPPVSLTDVVAVAALLVSGFVAFIQVRDRRIARHHITEEYTHQLMAWHSEVVQVLVSLSSQREEAVHANRSQLLMNLSALIEEGRFYFPNIRPDEFGVEKPLAYRGYRNIALDFLVASYNLHHKPISQSTRAQAKALQRQFTSVVFDIIRPPDRLKQIHRLTDRYFVKDLSVEDLEDPDQLDVVRHVWDRP